MEPKPILKPCTARNPEICRCCCLLALDLFLAPTFPPTLPGTKTDTETGTGSSRQPKGPGFNTMGRVRIITTHLSADFDAFAAAVCAVRLFPDSKVLFPGSQELAVRRFQRLQVQHVLREEPPRALAVSAQLRRGEDRPRPEAPRQFAVGGAEIAVEKFVIALC